MKRLLVTALMSLACSAANAEWKLLSISPDNGLILYVEENSKRVSGDIVKVWGRFSFETAQGELKYRSVLTHYNVNCKEAEVKISLEVAYPNEDGTGKILRTNELPDARWTPIVPNSFDESLQKWACR